MHALEKLQKKHTNENGRLCYKAFLSELANSEYYPRFCKIKERHPDLPLKALLSISQNGYTRCKFCKKRILVWHSRGEGHFVRYCGPQCSNNDPVVIEAQHSKLSEAAKAKQRAFSKVFEKLKATPIKNLTEDQIAAFCKAAEKTSYKREYEIFEHLPVRLQRVWANLPGNSSRSRLMMATGQIPLASNCKHCGVQLTRCSFYGWPGYCGRACSANATVSIRCTPESAQKAGLSNRERFLSMSAEDKAAYHAKRLLAQQKTMLRKYGADNASGVPSIVRKKLGKLFSTKTFQLGSREVLVQGYEPVALRAMLEHFKPNDIEVSGDGNVPTVRYQDADGKRRTYYPDFFLPRLNILVEVKSTYTLYGTDQWLKRNRCKARKALKAGYRFKMLVCSDNKCRILPDDWYSLSKKKLKDLCAFT